MASDAQGAQSRFCMEPGASPHTFDTASEPYDPLYETLSKKGRIVGGRTMRGTRSQAQERTRYGAFPVDGKVQFNVSPLDLDLWLPRMLGGAESSNSFPLAETLPSFGVLVDRVTTTFQYTDGMVNRWILHGQAGPGDGDPDLLELTLEIFFKTVTTGTTYPALTLGVAAGNYPYMINDCSTLTLAGAARQMKEFWLVGNNFIERRWTHSITTTRMSPRDRLINFRAVFPYDDDHDDLYGQARAGTTGTLTFTNAETSKVTSFVCGTLQSPDNCPNAMGKQEIDIVVEGTARKTGTTTELATTNAS